VNPTVNAFMKTASRFGRGLILLSLAISVYQVATADDPWSVGEREAAVTLGGIGAAAAGGALAGLACGPGAPVCVGLGAFVAGTIAAFGIQYAW
jgi:hypothetical protein